MLHRRKYINLAFLIFSFVVASGYFIVDFVAKRNSDWCGTESNYALIESDTTKEYKNGKILFQQCAGCHVLHKEAVGPDLIGFTKRGSWADKKKVLSYLREPFKFYKENKSKYVDSIYQSSPIAHLVFLWSEKNLDDLIYDLKSEEKNRQKGIP